MADRQNGKGIMIPTEDVVKKILLVVCSRTRQRRWLQTMQGLLTVPAYLEFGSQDLR